jgi:hypothetical protein
VLETITDTLKKRDRSASPVSASSPPRAQGEDGLNPGQKVHPGGDVPKFTAGSSLKQSVRGG